MRKRILWFIALLAVAAPVAAFVTRLRDERESARVLAAGLRVLDTPIERAVELDPGDVTRARALFERAWHADAGGDTGRHARALWHVAQAYVDLAHGEVVLARQESDTAARLLPGEPHVTLLTAVVAARSDDRAATERALALLAETPAARVPAGVAARAALLHADALLDSGRAHDALAAAEALDREHPAVVAVKNLLGLARGAVGDRAGAREAFTRAAQLDPRSETPLVNLARLARDEGDLPAARTLLERALAVVPESPEAWQAYGAVLAEQRAPTARQALVHAGAVAPDDPASYIAQGNLDLAEGNFAGATESFRGALARDPENATAQTNLGIALARRGDRAAAVDAFELATRRAPHQGEAWNGLGAMRLAMNNAFGAVGPLQQASALLPNDPNPPMNLALAFEALERWDDAARAYREVLRRAPDHAAAMRHLLRILPPTPTAPVRASSGLRPRRPSAT